jgi:hypothetical protein
VKYFSFGFPLGLLPDTACQFLSKKRLPSSQLFYLFFSADDCLLGVRAFKPGSLVNLVLNNLEPKFVKKRVRFFVLNFILPYMVARHSGATWQMQIKLYIYLCNKT